MLAMSSKEPFFIVSMEVSKTSLSFGFHPLTVHVGEKIAETLNQLNFSAMTLGNHEFDGGDEELGQFLQNLTFPVISANVHSENEKIKSKLQPYQIFPEYGMAIIGVTTPETPSISNPDDTTTFSDVLEVGTILASSELSR